MNNEQYGNFLELKVQTDNVVENENINNQINKKQYGCSYE